MPRDEMPRDVVELISRRLQPKNVLSLRQSSRMFRNALPQDPRMRNRLVKLFEWMMKWKKRMKNQLPELTIYLSSGEDITAHLSHFRNSGVAAFYHPPESKTTLQYGMVQSENPVELADKLAPLSASVTCLNLSIWDLYLQYRSPDFELIDADLLAGPVQGGNVKEKGLQRLTNILTARENSYETEIDLLLATGSIKQWFLNQHSIRLKEALASEAALLPFIGIRVSGNTYREGSVRAPKALEWNAPDWGLVDGDLLA